MRRTAYVGAAQWDAAAAATARKLTRTYHELQGVL